MENGKMGYVDEEEVEIVPPIYDACRHFSEGMVIVAKNGKHGYYDKFGRFTVPLTYKWGGNYSDNVVRVLNNEDKWGYIDTKNNVVIPLQYDYASDFLNGEAAVKKDGKWMFIDKRGNKVRDIPKIESGYYFIKLASNNNLVVDNSFERASDNNNVWLHDFNNSNAQKWYVFNNHDGSISLSIPPDKNSLGPRHYLSVINGSYDSAYEANVVIHTITGRDSDNWLLDQCPDGSYILHSALNPKFVLDVAGEFERNEGNIFLWEKIGDLEQKWKFVPANVYDFRGDLVEGMTLVKSNGKAGFIDKNQIETVAPKYENARNFSEGLAAVKTAGKYGYIDKSGKEVIPPIYSKAGDFSDGVARVFDGMHWGYIDKYGETALPMQYENASDFRNWSAAVKKDGKWMFIYKTGSKSQDIAKVKDGVYNIKVASNTYVSLDNCDGITQNGNNVRIYYSKDDNSQKWAVKNYPDGSISLTAMPRDPKTNKARYCIAIENGDWDSGNLANIGLQDENGSEGQRWLVTKREDGTYLLHSALNSKYVLDVWGPNENSGVNVQLFENIRDNGQKWIIKKTKGKF